MKTHISTFLSKVHTSNLQLTRLELYFDTLASLILNDRRAVCGVRECMSAIVCKQHYTNWNVCTGFNTIYFIYYYHGSALPLIFNPKQLEMDYQTNAHTRPIGDIQMSLFAVSYFLVRFYFYIKLRL